MTMITPSYLGETIEYSSLHACRSTLEDPTRIRGMPIFEKWNVPPDLLTRRALLMAILFAVFAFGTAVGAWRTEDRTMRLVLVAASLLNAYGAIEMVASHDPYAFKLHKNDGRIEPDYRSDD